MWELTKRISSVLSTVEPEPDLCTGSGFATLAISVVDPDPHWIRIQELPGSGSVF